jgi:predicted MFS family arabinose efflux permease
MTDKRRAVAATLLAALAASQAALVVLNPVLPEIASDFDVSVATAG